MNAKRKVAASWMQGPHISCWWMKAAGMYKYFCFLNTEKVTNGLYFPIKRKRLNFQLPGILLLNVPSLQLQLCSPSWQSARLIYFILPCLWTWPDKSINCQIQADAILPDYSEYLRGASKASSRFENIFLSPALLISCCLTYHNLLPFLQRRCLCDLRRPHSCCLQVSSRVERRLQELEREMLTDRERRPEQHVAVSEELQEVTRPPTHLLQSLYPTAACWHTNTLSHS